MSLRPVITHFLSIKLHERFSIRATLNLERIKKKDEIKSPMHDLDLLKGNIFHLKMLCLNKSGEVILEKIFESDQWGQFRINLTYDLKNPIHSFKLYELLTQKGLEFYLGEYYPSILGRDKKVIVSDFDKTLIDNKHSTPKELWDSFTSPLNSFRTITASVSYLKNYIQNDYFPILLSASPHFYARAIKHWLKEQGLDINCVLLKNYLKTLSFFEYFHSQNHAAFKLNEILEFFLFTEIPKELVLIGDDSQTDPLVYSTIEKILKKNPHPLNLIEDLSKHHRSFQAIEIKAKTLKNLFQMQKALDLEKEQARDITIAIRNT